MGRRAEVQFRDAFGRVWTVEVAVASAVFGIVVLGLVYAIVRYRGSRQPSASQNTEHTRVEAAVAVGILAVALSLYLFTYRENSQATAAARPDVTIDVSGFQWCWRFHYRMPTPLTVTANCVDGHTPTLVVPTHRSIEFRLQSDDVIHSFWVPHLRYKLDAFPHHTNSFVAEMSEPGTWQGHCAQFCGVGHSSMLFTLRAVSPAEFDAWLRRTAGSSAAGNRP